MGRAQSSLESCDQVANNCLGSIPLRNVIEPSIIGNYLQSIQARSHYYFSQKKSQHFLESQAYMLADIQYLDFENSVRTVVGSLRISSVPGRTSFEPRAYWPRWSEVTRNGGVDLEP